MLTGFPHVLKRYGLHADVRVVMDLYRVMEMGLVNSLGSLFDTAQYLVCKSRRDHAPYTLAFMMEGRIRMEALKLLILKMRSGDASSKAGLKPGFKQILESYKKALKRASVRNPQSQDIPVLSEFVQMTLFAQTHRILLEIELGRMRQLLEAAQKACHALVRADGHHLLLQERLNSILKRYGLYAPATI